MCPISRSVNHFSHCECECDPFFRMWPTFQKMTNLTVQPTFLNVANFSQLNQFSNCDLCFYSVTHFLQCDLFFLPSAQFCVCSIFHSVRNFSKGDPLVTVWPIFPCDPFFTAWLIFPHVAHFSQRHPFITVRPIFTAWPVFQMWHFVTVWKMGHTVKNGQTVENGSHFEMC